MWRMNTRTCAASRVLAIMMALATMCGLAKDPPKAELVLKDLSGLRVRLSDLRGKAVVLNFWATWCGPCQAEMPMLVEMEKKYASQGVVFVGASLDEPKSRPKIPEFLVAHHIEFPIWVGANFDDLDHLRMGPAVPATAFLDTGGHIIARVCGQIREEEVSERLDWLTGRRPSAPPPALISHLEK